MLQPLYDHTQEAPLGIILLASALLSGIVLAMVLPPETAVLIGLLVVVGTALLSQCFWHLRVRDEETHLSVRFGPLRVFGTRIPYSEIVSVEAVRSGFMDGWGVHWVPGRGMIYNLWGFDCVKIQRGKRYVRVGTDDVDALTAFLNDKVNGKS